MSELSSYGICAFTLIPVRSTPEDSAELTTQLLLGEGYEVLETSDNDQWLHIRSSCDGYEGWIDKKQHIETDAIPEDYTEFPLVSGDIGLLKGKDYTLRALKGSFLPGLDEDHQICLGNHQYTYQGEWQYPDLPSAEVYGVRYRLHIIETARSFLRAPYLWGGKSLTGLDCSAFVQLVYRFAGISLCRDAWQQAEQGSPLNGLEESGAGDLAFFLNEKDKVVHVGVLTEYGKIIHASGFVRLDQLDNEGIYNVEKGQYTHRLGFVRRYFSG